MAAHTQARGRWTTQARLDALLRFNPQRAQLAQQIREAREGYGATVKSTRTSARETEASTRRAIPLLAAIYGNANTATQAGATLVSKALADAPSSPAGQPTLDAYKTGEAGEVQQQIANIASRGASDQAAMVNRGVQARAGAQFAQLNAKQQLTHQLQQLFGSQQRLRGEQGAFASAEADKLTHEAEAMEQSERQSRRSAETSRTNAQNAEAGAERRSRRSANTSRQNAKEAHDGKGASSQKGVERAAKAGSAISKMRNYASPLFASSQSRAEVLHRLSQDEPSISTKTSSGQSIHIPGRKGFSPDVLMSAALDAAQTGGYVSRGTLSKLRDAGYIDANDEAGSLHRLGLKPPQSRSTSGVGVTGGSR